MLLACECDEQWRDECILDGMEFHDGAGGPSGTGVGGTIERSDGSRDKPDVDMEYIDWSDIVPSTGIDGCRVWDNGSGSK